MNPVALRRIEYWLSVLEYVGRENIQGIVAKTMFGVVFGTSSAHGAINTDDQCGKHSSKTQLKGYAARSQEVR